MAKKNKKIFKQKVRQLLTQGEAPASPKENILPNVAKEKELPKTPSLPVAKAAATTTLIAPEIVKADLKKITLLIIILLAIVAGVAIISAKTSWLEVISNRLYNWTQLGA
jgi:hypothetical protein